MAQPASAVPPSPSASLSSSERSARQCRATARAQPAPLPSAHESRTSSQASAVDRSPVRTLADAYRRRELPDDPTPGERWRAWRLRRRGVGEQWRANASRCQHGERHEIRDDARDEGKPSDLLQKEIERLGL